MMLGTFWWCYWSVDHNVIIKNERKPGCKWGNIVLGKCESEHGWLDV